MDEETALGLDTSNPTESSEDSGPSFTVTVDGEQMDVSQSELINGYQRQADYTRKTQELATERERLAQGEAIVQKNWTQKKPDFDELSRPLKNKIAYRDSKICKKK